MHAAHATLVVVLAAVALGAVQALAAGYTDSGYEIAPGYKVPVMLRAEGTYDLEAAFAPVAVRLEGQSHFVEVGINAEQKYMGAELVVFFFVKVDGDYELKSEIDTLKPLAGWVAYDEHVTLMLNCDGVLTVRSEYGTVKVPMGRSNVDIYEYTTSVDPLLARKVESKVTYGEPERFEVCFTATTTTPNLPQAGSGASGGETVSPRLKLALLGLGAGAIVAGGVLLASRRR